VDALGAEGHRALPDIAEILQFGAEVVVTAELHGDRCILGFNLILSIITTFWRITGNAG
jgi:hypothetical protein